MVISLIQSTLGNPRETEGKYEYEVQQVRGRL